MNLLHFTVWVEGHGDRVGFGSSDDARPGDWSPLVVGFTVAGLLAQRWPCREAAPILGPLGFGVNRDRFTIAGGSALRLEINERFARHSG
jgi:hypothetical protein